MAFALQEENLAVKYENTALQDAFTELKKFIDPVVKTISLKKVFKFMTIGFFQIAWDLFCVYGTNL
jgi:hypothetical protein